MSIFVIPVKPGIQEDQFVKNLLVLGFHRGDEFLKIRNTLGF